ncbi:MAG: UDP-N-acetylmuramate--L-alanine ligase [Planctomycetota bacterium]
MSKYYLLGIGGAGLSALGHYLVDSGNQVCGYDLTKSWELKYLLERGINFYENTFNLADINNHDIFIKTLAINDEMPVVKTAKLLSKPVYNYPEYLGIISAQHNNVIAVCGAHGKTTVAGLSAFLLSKYGLSPSYIVGGIISNFQKNGKYGSPQYLVVEACEFRESFLNLTPRIIIANNIEMDHTDYYHDIGKLKNAYLKFFQKSCVEYIIYNKDCKLLTEVVNEVKDKIKISFGSDRKSDYTISNFSNTNRITFDVVDKKNDSYCIVSHLYGYHSAYNIVAVLALCDILGLDRKYFRNFVLEFQGVERRMQTIEIGQYTFILDYAHHPTQLNNVVHILSMKNGKDFLVVFQPHQLKRLLYFEKEFLSIFQTIENLILTPVYKAREEYDEGDTIQRFIDILKRYNTCYYFHSYADIANFIKTSGFKTILLAGAGDIYRVLEYFNYEENHKKKC